MIHTSGIQERIINDIFGMRLLLYSQYIKHKLKEGHTLNEAVNYADETIKTTDKKLIRYLPPQIPVKASSVVYILKKGYRTL